MRWWMVPWVAVLSLAGVLLPVPPVRAGLISEREELQMGDDAARQIEAEQKVSRDGKETELVRSIGEKLTAVSSRPSLPWKFAVLQNKEVNALSVPGHVYVNQGLIDFVGGDREELAAVIAHEIAHTTRKHAVRQTEKAVIGGLALDLIFGDKRGVGPQLAGAAANLALLGYGRKDELEADRTGAEYMMASGYDPYAMVRFFKKLQAKEGKETGGLAVYFRTHPPTKERIRMLEGHLAKIVPAQKPRASLWPRVPVPAMG